MTLTAIVAMTPSRIIGKSGDLPWHLPEDLKFFKRTTSGHPIVMGRKTYDSIGYPLPKRRNIVLTRDAKWSADGVEVIHSPEELSKLNDLPDQAFIIGGSEIYSAFLTHLDELIISHVKSEYDGDTRFPAFDDQFPHCELVEEFDDFTVKRWTKNQELGTRN